MKILNVALLLLSFTLVSCATIFGKSSDEVSFTSIPAGAKIYNGDKLMGVTPFTHVFDRDTFNHIHITIRKDGYESQKFMMKKTIAKAAIFNLTSVLSWGTDALSGNMMEYSPKSYLIELKKQGRASAKEIRHSQLTKLMALKKHEFFEDVAKGEGETLENVMELYEVPARKRMAVVSRLKGNLTHLLIASEPVALSTQIEANL